MCLETFIFLFMKSSCFSLVSCNNKQIISWNELPKSLTSLVFWSRQIGGHWREFFCGLLWIKHNLSSLSVLWLCWRAFLWHLSSVQLFVLMFEINCKAHLCKKNKNKNLKLNKIPLECAFLWSISDDSCIKRNRKEKKKPIKWRLGGGVNVSTRPEQGVCKSACEIIPVLTLATSVNNTGCRPMRQTSFIITNEVQKCNLCLLLRWLGQRQQQSLRRWRRSRWSSFNSHVTEISEL